MYLQMILSFLYFSEQIVCTDYIHSLRQKATGCSSVLTRC